MEVLLLGNLLSATLNKTLIITNYRDDLSKWQNDYITQYCRIFHYIFNFLNVIQLSRNKLLQKENLFRNSILSCTCTPQYHNIISIKSWSLSQVHCLQCSCTRQCHPGHSQQMVLSVWAALLGRSPVWARHTDHYCARPTSTCCTPCPLWPSVPPYTWHSQSLWRGETLNINNNYIQFYFIKVNLIAAKLTLKLPCNFNFEYLIFESNNILSDFMNKSNWVAHCCNLLDMWCPSQKQYLSIKQIIFILVFSYFL